LTPTTPDPSIAAPAPRSSKKLWAWRIGRYVLGIGALVAAVWAISGKTDELQGATTYLANVRWWWLILALVAEGASYLALSSLQRRLLWAGRVRVPVGSMMGITMAGSAIQYSLPAGTVFSYAYDFRQYRRYGADDVLAGWTLVAFNAVAFVCLASLAAVGLALALSAGNTFDLVESILGVLIVAALLVVAWAERAVLLPYITRVVRLSQKVLHRPRRDLPADEVVANLFAHLGAVNPTRGNWARAGVMGMSNWLGDMACLALSFIAVGAGVPWRGLILAYGAGQLATALPVTPGGLGAVEGSLTLALVTFGGAKASTVAAVLLYRLISFWLVLPIGWGSWLVLALHGRSQRRVP
jgi:putative heme transporter